MIERSQIISFQTKQKRNHCHLSNYPPIEGDRRKIYENKKYTLQDDMLLIV